MRRAHESLLLLGGILLALAPSLYYVSYLAITPGVLCLLCSLGYGIAHLRQCLPAGAVGVRSHLTYFVVAASLAGIFAPGYEALCCPTTENAAESPVLYVTTALPILAESPALYVTTALPILCSVYVIPFAFIRWADGRRLLRLRTAWLLLVASALLPVVLWAREAHSRGRGGGRGTGADGALAPRPRTRCQPPRPLWPDAADARGDVC